MNFHDICEYYGDDQFCNFKQEALQLPAFEFAKEKLTFLTLEQSKFKVTEGDKSDEYEIFAYKIDDSIPDGIKTHMDTMIESRNAFFQVVKYILAVSMINKITYFHSFAIRANLVVPEGVDPKTLTKEDIEKLDRKPVIILRGCPKKGDEVEVVSEARQEVVPTPK